MGEAKVVLIDTSAWVEALRKSGSATVRDRVSNLLISGDAAWCDMVILELWNGVRGEYEKKQLGHLVEEMLCLSTSDDVWRLARTLARECRNKGHTIPVADLLIAACAFVHEADIEHCDEHFDIVIRVYQDYTEK